MKLFGKGDRGEGKGRVLKSTWLTCRIPRVGHRDQAPQADAAHRGRAEGGSQFPASCVRGFPIRAPIKHNKTGRLTINQGQT